MRTDDGTMVKDAGGCSKHLGENGKAFSIARVSQTSIEGDKALSRREFPTPHNGGGEL